MKKYKPYLNRVDLVKNQVEREELREQEAKRKRSRRIQEQNRQRWLKYQEQLRSELAARYFHSVQSVGGEEAFNTYSVAFDGTDDHVDCGNDSSLQPTDEFSVSAWFKSAVVGNSTNNFIWSKLYFRLLILPTSGRIGFIVHRSAGQSTARYTPDDGTSYSDGNWHHVVATFKKNDPAAASYKIYVDGELKVDAGGYNSNVFASSDSFKIGAKNVSGTTGMNGNIDEVAFWKTKLTLTDVQNIYNDGVPNDISSYNPISWWRMGDNDGGTGTTVTDQGSAGNNGTLINDAVFEENTPS